MRVGIGNDWHPLVSGRDLVLGGIKIPSDKGLKGHSDGDLLTHSVIDALLGAANLGDIGSHFPPDDSRFKDISSVILLGKVHAMLMEAHWNIMNIDATIMAETPKLQGYTEGMCLKLATSLDIEKSKISVKAKSGNGLGFVGNGEGIAGYAVALLENKS